ncbi:histidine kinase [Sphingobacterium faecium]|uniref:histidine kinase n=1 Tax=Sphingobacterium faecium TaxID=34087 RepID=UPI0032093B7E
MNDIEEKHLLSTFVFDKKYQVWRHVLFIAFAAVITFNQVLIAYQDCQVVLGNDIYLIGGSSLMTYLIVMYFNYFYLTPKFLLRDRIWSYLIITMICMLSLPVLSLWIEYGVRNWANLNHRIADYSSPLILIDIVSTSVITLICFCGISLILLYRTWSVANQHVSVLEIEHLTSELKKLKGQITPEFLSRALHHASLWTIKDPQKTNDILLKLSELLRYQLYDAQQEKTLLNSELLYVTKFISLEKRCRPILESQLKIDKQHHYHQISPMLLLTLVQTFIKESNSLEISSNVENNMLTFVCKSHSITGALEDQLISIRKRLDLAYSHQYILQLETGSVTLKLALCH